MPPENDPFDFTIDYGEGGSAPPPNADPLGLNNPFGGPPPGPPPGGDNPFGPPGGGAGANPFGPPAGLFGL